ncbi:protein POF1B [Boleophthalmus pectinirostris]|uniref:protein POF1B n=1 Tax=Boleophthalmus pectinirostris TaxID=150288 RepID=UPI002432E025|nr:protein POF1B [Boleophthalmus pectinirostris]
MSVQTTHKTTTTSYRSSNLASQEQSPTSTTYRTLSVASPEPTATTYRTLSVASPEPTTTTYRTLSVASPEPTTTTYRTLRVATPEPATSAVISAAPVSPLPVSQMQYAVNGSYDVRYLVPVQTAVQQPSYVFMQQPMIQQPVMQPVYVQSVPQLSVSSTETDHVFQRQTLESISGKSSVFSQSSSPIKSPVPSMEEEEEEEEEEETVELEEVEIVNVIQNKAPPVLEKISRTEVKTCLTEVPPPTKLDTRYFGELLAEVYRKNCDIHSCISEHVSKIKGQKLDSYEYKMERDQVEALIPKGATELTKQQMRYLLQTRLTADKSMRLLLSTFSTLREELLHMSEDLRRLEAEKETLERDLAFRADQAKQYNSLLENVRENNRQLQNSLKEATVSQRALESQLMSCKNNDSSRDFKLKELEGRLHTLEKENEILRSKLAGQASSSSLQIKTEELSRQYREDLNSMKEEKDREIEKLKSQISRLQTRVTSSTTTTTQSSSAGRSLELKISELLATLSQRESTITRQEAEIKRLLQERNDSSKNVTRTTITKRYSNQYPLLALLGDDYVTSPSTLHSLQEDRTVVIERT